MGGLVDPAPTLSRCSARHSSPAVRKASAPAGLSARLASSKTNAMRDKTVATTAAMVIFASQSGGIAQHRPRATAR